MAQCLGHFSAQPVSSRKSFSGSPSLLGKILSKVDYMGLSSVQTEPSRKLRCG